MKNFRKCLCDRVHKLFNIPTKEMTGIYTEVDTPVKRFSNGFLSDLIYLIETCQKNNANNIDLYYNVDDKVMKINISFSFMERKTKD